MFQVTRTTLLALLFCVALSAFATAEQLAFTTEGNFEMGADSYRRGDIAIYDAVGSTSNLFFDRDNITAGNQRVAALHFFGNQQIIFTTNGDFDIGANEYDRGDLVLYNLETGANSLFFDQALITSGNDRITAAYVTGDNNLIFTTNGNFGIGANSYNRGDLVQYNLGTGANSLFFDRDLITGGNDDVTSAHVLKDGDLLFTTRGNSSIGTASFSRGDVIRYDFGTGTASLYLSRDVVTNGNQNITAFSVVPEPSSTIFLGLVTSLLFALRRKRGG